jgi:hypothetical protein
MKGEDADTTPIYQRGSRAVSAMTAQDASRDAVRLRRVLFTRNGDTRPWPWSCSPARAAGRCYPAPASAPPAVCLSAHGEARESGWLLGRGSSTGLHLLPPGYPSPGPGYPGADAADRSVEKAPRNCMNGPVATVVPGAVAKFGTSPTLGRRCDGGRSASGAFQVPMCRKSGRGLAAGNGLTSGGPWGSHDQQSVCSGGHCRHGARNRHGCLEHGRVRRRSHN